MNRAALVRWPLALAALSVAAAISSSQRPAAAEDAASPPRSAVPADAPVGAPAPCAPTEQKSFASAEDAAKALFDAMERNDDATLRSLTGSNDVDLVQDGADPIVRTQRREMAAAARTRLLYDTSVPGRVTLVIGEMAHPLAIPLRRDGDRFRFDTAAGREELLARRIGEHELEAIGICLAYADAQVAYARRDRDGDGVLEYAQTLSSTPGQKDGLHWDSAAGEDQSPAGPELVPLREGTAGTDTSPPREPFNGYLWRVLTAQGAHAPGGAYSYVVNGNMVAGFALLGVPAVHRNTGVMSFLVSHHGKVYERDLGPDTAKVAATITTFDPDLSWREVDDATLAAAAETAPADAPFVKKDAKGSEKEGDAKGDDATPASPAAKDATPPSSAPAKPDDDSIPAPLTPAVPAGVPPGSMPRDAADVPLPTPEPPRVPCHG